MTAELPPTNPGQIADDSYWQEPAIPIEGRFGAAISNIRFHDDRAKELIKLVQYMAKSQLEITPINEFDTTAQSTEGSKKLIKVVQDTRWLRVPSPMTISTRKQRAAFEERAEAMAATGLYLGREARTWTSHSSWRTAEVVREVSYFTYQEGERYLFGLDSDRFADYEENQLSEPSALLSTGANVRPPLLVGQIYEKGLIARNGLTKVIAADIIQARDQPSRRRLRPRPRPPRGDQGPGAHDQWASNGACVEVVIRKNPSSNMLH